MEHHPNLTLRSAQPLSYNRAICANTDTLNDYFAKLGAIYAWLNILAKPMQIFILDEFGVTVVHNPGKLITELGKKNVWFITSGEKGKTHTYIDMLCECHWVRMRFHLFLYTHEREYSKSSKKDVYHRLCLHVVITEGSHKTFICICSSVLLPIPTQ